MIEPWCPLCRIRHDPDTCPALAALIDRWPNGSAALLDAAFQGALGFVDRLGDRYAGCLFEGAIVAEKELPNGGRAWIRGRARFVKWDRSVAERLVLHGLLEERSAIRWEYAATRAGRWVAEWVRETRKRSERW